MATQTSAWPTRKMTTMALATPAFDVLIGDAVREVWPQIVPAALAGANMTTFMAAFLSAVLAAAIAYFVPDAPNTPAPE